MTFKGQVEQLKLNKGVIEGLSATVSQDQAAWRPGKDRWSLLETICHLRDIEREDFFVEIKMILNQTDESWPDFSIDAWVRERDYAGQDMGAALSDFLEARDRSIGYLNSLDMPDLDARHSGKGFNGEPMRAGDVMAAWLAHDYAHIRQLALLRRDILEEFNRPYSSAYSGFDYV